MCKDEVVPLLHFFAKESLSTNFPKSGKREKKNNEKYQMPIFYWDKTKSGTGLGTNTLTTSTKPKTGQRLPVIGMGTWRTFNVGSDPQLLNARAEAAAIVPVLWMLLSGLTLQVLDAPGAIACSLCWQSLGSGWSGKARLRKNIKRECAEKGSI